jgi:integrase
LALFVYTRHTADCAKRDDRFWKRCRCPKWIRGVVDSKTIRQTAHTRSWEKAEQLRKSMDDGGAPLPAVPLTIVQALADFIADAEMRNLAPGTLSKLKTLRGQLEAWAKERGLRYLKELTVAELSVFRSSWQDAGLSRKIKQQRLSSFFLFAIRNGWLTENPVKKLSRILVRDTPTDYFPEAEFQAILAALDKYKPKAWIDSKHQAERLRTLTLLMRWSGLRIGDAVTLERTRLVGDSVLLYQQKTGTAVYVPLPPEVADVLRNVPSSYNSSPRYFFWSGQGSVKSLVSNWQKRYQALFALAKLKKADGSLKRCYPHMFRDTFAVEMLLAGVPLEQVSILLGHKSVKITEKHYLPWVKARQEQLEQSVRKAWNKSAV